jgi:hypothetical protein
MNESASCLFTQTSESYERVTPGHPIGRYCSVKSGLKLRMPILGRQIIH